MINLKLINKANDSLAPISYVESDPLHPTKNIGLVDYASRRAANSAGFFHIEQLVSTDVVSPILSSDGVTPSLPIHLLTNDVVVGDRAVLSPGVSFGAALFFRSFLGRGPVICLYSTGGSVSVTVSSTTLAFNSTVVTWTDKSTRQVVEEVNQAGDGIIAQVLVATEASLSAGSFSATTSGLNLKNTTYRRVYSPGASTSDLDAARETIKRAVDLLIDGKKSNEVLWDLNVVEYETNGFIVEIYTDRQTLDGKTLQVRFNSIDKNNNIFESRVEILNLEPYFVEDVHYNITDNTTFWEIEVSDQSYAWGVGLFSQTGNNHSVTTTDTQVQLPSYNLDYEGKSLSDIAAEINENLGATITASVLSSNAGIIPSGGLFSSSYTVKPSGTPLLLNKAINVLRGPGSRIHPLLPYGEDALSPWFPRIRRGTFSEYLPSDTASYGTAYGQLYGGAYNALYTYSVPEFDGMLFDTALGNPYRKRILEPAIIHSPKVLRTARRPLESIASIKLYDGTTDISSEIEDIDIQQGFIFLSRDLSSYDFLQIAYTYEEKSFIYTGVNLNPVDDPTIIGKYVGVYLIPMKVENLWSSLSTAHHVIRNTEESIVQELSRTELSSGTAANPLLVGIYQVYPSEAPEDVLLTRVNRKGGGLKEELSPMEESKFFWDIGRLDGEPFESQGAVLVEVPTSVLQVPTSSDQYTYDPQNSDQNFMSPSELWTKEEIERRVRRWAAFGSVVVVRTDD